MLEVSLGVKGMADVRLLGAITKLPPEHGVMGTSSGA